MKKEDYIIKKLSEPNQYISSYVAFLDMLGFKNVCSKKEVSCQEIKAIFDDIELIKLNFDKTLCNFIISKDVSDKTSFTIMSDSVVISAPDNDDGLVFLLYLCSFIHNCLLENGIPLRGGIAKGDFYKLDNIMYGPALIEAYNLESEFAVYPRTIISDSIIAELKSRYLFCKKTVPDYLSKYSSEANYKSNHNSEIEIFIKKSLKDEKYFVDYFNPLQQLANSKKPYRIEKITKVINNGLTNTNDRIRKKYEWLNEYLEQNHKII